MEHHVEMATGWFSPGGTNVVPAAFDQASIRLRLRFDVVSFDDYR